MSGLGKQDCSFFTPARSPVKQAVGRFWGLRSDDTQAIAPIGVKKPLTQHPTPEPQSV
ncbi:MAG: hypothetical protein F6J93_17550 [Oscillatoria sp. SIO1A7]|nr:hypothetical protein [Oscillatoria sp. SIO1A7]